MNVGVVLVAAGQGTRLGAGQPKAFVPLAGDPLLTHALRGVLSCPDLTDVVVVAPPDRMPQAREAIERATPAPVACTVVAGGAARTDSVRSGLAALPDRVGIVLVHDAARALTPATVFSRVVGAVRQGAAAVVPAVPVTDTVKQVEVEQATGKEVVTGTPDRATLRAVQTPQGFLRETLERAHAEAVGPATDDASLVELAGGHVHVVAGDALSRKVTTPEDLRWAGLTLGMDTTGMTRGGSVTGPPRLVVLSGRPGVGKTVVARELARLLDATHLRIDTVEQALIATGTHPPDLGPVGYVVGERLAADQLALGRDVVGDAVMGVDVVRDAWEQLAARAGARLLRVELVCSDAQEHRRRVEGRTADIPGHQLPDWGQATTAPWHPWAEADLRLDTAHLTPQDCARAIEERLR